MHIQCWSIAILSSLLAIGCGKKKQDGEAGGGGGAPVKTTVHTVDDPGFSVDLPEGFVSKRTSGSAVDEVGMSADFEGKGVFDSVSLTWKKLPAGVTAASAIDEGKAGYSKGEPDLKATQVEGALPGGGPWVAVAKGKFKGSKSWLTLGDVLVSCQGGGVAADVCKQLRAK